MLKFRDSTGKVKFILRDSDTQPVDIDKLVMDQSNPTEEEKEKDKEPLDA